MNGLLSVYYGKSVNASKIYSSSISCRDSTKYSIQDVDGEFLLIESALHIPDWLKPETAENRVSSFEL